MSREVCGICWCPYDEDTGECACAPEPKEPVAWRWGYRSVTTGEMDWRGYVEIAAHPNLRNPAIIMQPLYTAPPQRTPEQCIDILLRRMNISELAQAIGVDASAISHVKAGRSRITHYEKVDKLRSMV